MTRAVDPTFDCTEKVWRRIEKRAVGKDRRLKPSAFRLQVSVARERYGTIGEVTQGKWNGVAEATASALVALAFGDLRVACVDEPLKTDDAHALVAAVLDPGKPAPADVKNAVRQAFANTFHVVTDPT